MEEIPPTVVVDAGMDASIDTIRSRMIALLPRLRRFALSLTCNRSDADDLVQDAVERALRNLHQWERGTRLDSWMFRIMQNIFIDRRRAQKRASAVMEESSDPNRDASIDGARVAEARLTWQQTCAALGRLPDEQRSAVALVLIDGMSYREAAEILQVPVGTLTSRLSRAREALALRIFGSATGVEP